eukprot:gene2285-2458_t
MNPLELVKSTTNYVMKHSKHVKINFEKLKNFNEKEEIKWDFESVHYFKKEDEELSSRYILILSSLNFCFWPLNSFEYGDLAKGLKKTIENDPNSFNNENLMKMNEKTFLKWFDGIKLPQMDERIRLIKEIGFGLEMKYKTVKNLIKGANQSVINLVNIIIETFPAFRDHSIFNGRQIFFYKRAQIFCADIHGSFSGEGIGKFNDINELTSFADYRVPQILRHLEIFEYSKELSDKIDSGIEIYPGSIEEIEIRALTVQCVELMKNEKIAIEVDWKLWQMGEMLRKEIKPHHKTLTIYY